MICTVLANQTVTNATSPEKPEVCPPSLVRKLMYGGGIMFASEDLGGRFDHSFPTRAFYFFKSRSARASQFHFLG